MTRKALRDWMMSRGLSILEGTTQDRIRAFEKAMRYALPRKSISDRTCHRNVVAWLEKEVASSRWTPSELLTRMIDALLEATSPSAKNPNALFMSILKQEFGYPEAERGER